MRTAKIDRASSWAPLINTSQRQRLCRPVVDERSSKCRGGTPIWDTYFASAARRTTIWSSRQKTTHTRLPKSNWAPAM